MTRSVGVPRRPVPGLRAGLVGLAAILLLPGVCWAQGEPAWEAWKIRINDEVWLIGARAPLVGTVEEHRDPGLWWFTAKGTTAKGTLRKDEIDHIDFRQTPKKVYGEKLKLVGPTDLVGHYGLAMNCMMLRNLELQALEEFKKVLELKPDLPWAYESLVKFFTELPDGALRISALEVADLETSFWLQAKEHGIESPGVFFRLGMVYLEMDLLLPAGAAFDDALGAAEDTDWPLKVDADLKSAEIMERLERYPDAANIYEDLLKREDLSSRETYIAWKGLGFASLRGGEFERAVQAFQAAAELEPESPDSREHLGCVEYARGNFREAERLFAEAAKMHEELSGPPPRLVVNLALARCRLGYFADADADLAGAEEVTASEAEIFIARAYLQLCRGEAEAALEALARADELRPEDPYVAYLSGVALRDSGKREEALGVFRGALMAGMDASLCFRAMAETHWALGNPKETVKYLEYSWAGRSPTPEERARIAQALVKAGRGDDALREVEAALTEDPDFAPGILLLAYLLYQNGDYAGSRTAFERALGQGGEDEYAREALTKVKELADLQVWTDTFDREDGEKVRNRWDESERNGIEIGIKENHCVLRGTQKGASGTRGRTFLSRTLDRSNSGRFVRVEADLTCPQGEEIRSGVRLEVGKSGRVIVFVENGELHYAYQKRRGPGAASKWRSERIGDWQEGRHTIGIALASRKRWRFEILLNGEKVKEFDAPLMNLARKELVIGIYGEAPEGASWGLSLDEVRIFRQGPLRPGEEEGH